jgi:RNA-directed DNA polymerase
MGEAKPPGVPAADKQGGEDLWQRHGAERTVWSERMLAALETGLKGKKWFSLIDKVARLDVLQLAWEKVRSNAGACGVDGITVGRFSKDSQNRLLAVKKQLEEGSYQPRPVKRVWIPKPGSAEKRPLGVPTVRDRVVQTAVRMVIEPIFERTFAAHSYGFRPGRSCKDALRRVEELLRSGHVHVVEVDIRGYFDAILQPLLLERVGEEIADGKVLDLIGKFLRQGVMEEKMEIRETERGTPQGGVISPLLANIYLNPLDWLLAEAGLEMVRYADDMVVLCREASQAETALELIRDWMAQAGLELHPEKTRQVCMEQAGGSFEFLGYRFWCARSGKLSRLIREKSRRSLREGLKPLTRRNSGESLGATIARINPILQGWYGYFRHAHTNTLLEMDQWVRTRLRSILRKRQGGQGRGRGMDHLRWPNCYFDTHGLFNLAQTRLGELASLR